MAKASRYAIVDLETTGGDPRSARITEVAIFLFDGEEIIDQFTSLVNPERAIPHFITRLTGIDNDMVRNAPKFYEIARRIVEITQDAVFVAHNVRFDFGFLQHAFRRLGYSYSRKQLCTVKLSRKRMPGLPSYSLGNLCIHLKIKNKAAHRAAGDAAATVQLFQHLLQTEEGGKVQDSLALEISLNRLPPNLDKSIVDNLPEEPGVYYFLGEKGDILYVGKSNNIRKRILSHFQGAHKSRKTMNMISLIHDLSFERTGSELIALLFENEEIKRIQPPFNRAQRRRTHKYGAYMRENEEGYLCFYIGEYDSQKTPLAGYGSRSQGEATLDSRGRQFQLCPKLYDAEKGSGRCFQHQLHLCLGACAGDESAEAYNLRARQAMSVLSYGRSDMGNFLVVGEGREIEERSVVWIKQGRYQGYGYLDEGSLSLGWEELLSHIPAREELPDVHRIIQGYVKKHQKEVVKMPASILQNPY